MRNIGGTDFEQVIFFLYVDLYFLQNINDSNYITRKKYTVYL